MYSKNGLSTTNHWGTLILLLTFIWGFAESIFQEICSKVENFLILSLSLPGRGVPFTIQERTNDLSRISDTDLPLDHEAKKLYEQTCNGQLTDEPRFGLDSLSGDDALIQPRSDLFWKKFDITKIFGEVTNGQSLKLKQAILDYITTTNRLS